MSCMPTGEKTNKQTNTHLNRRDTCKTLGFSLSYGSQRQHITVLKDSLLSLPPCLAAYFPGKKFFIHSLSSHALFSIKYITHSIKKGLELRKKFKGLSKINPIKKQSLYRCCEKVGGKQQQITRKSSDNESGFTVTVFRYILMKGSVITGAAAIYMGKISCFPHQHCCPWAQVKQTRPDQ